MKKGICCLLLLLMYSTSFSQEDKCNIDQLPSLQFRSRSVKISRTDSALLVNVSEQIKQSPECKIKVSGHAEGSKMGQQTSWERVHSVINFLVEKRGISPERLIFEYGNEGNPNTVDLIPTQEQGYSTIPAPHPNLRESPNSRVKPNSRRVRPK